MDDLFSSSPSSPARRSVLLAGGAALGTYALGAFGKWSDWPSKPVRIVAGQAPGSSNDAMGRALADFLSQKLGVPVIVENKPGGVGMIAAEAVARSAPDGHTLLFPLYSQMAQGPVLLRRPPVNPDTALVPIGAMGVGPAPVVVNKNFPVKTLDELISYAKKKPVNVGNYAIGSGWHLMLNQLMNETGAQFNIANYKGTGAMLVDLYAIALHTSCDDGVVNRAKKAFTRGFESAGEANKWWQRVGQRRSSGTLIWAIGASTSARCCWPRAWQRIHRRASRALVGAGQKRPLPIAFCPKIGWNGTTS